MKEKVLKGREDRISDLTNDILVRILSFLPTDDVVRTSVLSKRWNRVWASVPVLVFDDGDPPKKNETEFMNFVDRVLNLHDIPSLYKFSLKCWCSYDPCRINAWISTALNRNVQELHLFIEAKNPFAYPRSLFISDTLTFLELHPSGPSRIKIPTAVCLPLLKFLYLDAIYFFTYQSSQRVSFNFPMLQKFKLRGCEWEEIESVEIFAPTLEKLIIHDYDCINFAGCEIKVYAESLKSLELITDLSNYLILCNLTSLAKAYIRIINSGDTEDTDRHLISNIFLEISKVKHLTISDLSLRFLSEAENLPLLLNFSSLVHLEVNVDRYTHCDHILHFTSSENLIEILHLLPTVKYFQFHNSDSLECAFGDSIDPSNEVLPEGCLSHLKVVKLKKFCGCKDELLFVKDLLNNATTLTEMSITSRPELLKDTMRYIKIARKLLMLPKVSKCVIRFF